jgi:hypothetical protein
LAANVNAALQSETQGREGNDAGYEKFPGWMRSTFVWSSSGACSVVQGPLLTSPGGRFNLVPHMEYSLSHLLFSLYTVQQFVFVPSHHHSSPLSGAYLRNQQTALLAPR